MSILAELNALVAALGIPVETGVFSGEAPAEYVVITPLTDTFDGFADNRPQYDIQEARLSLFSKGSYTKRKNAIVRVLMDADFTITDRRFIGREDETGYFHVVIDTQKHYVLED